MNQRLRPFEADRLRQEPWTYDDAVERLLRWDVQRSAGPLGTLVQRAITRRYGRSLRS